MSLTYRLMPVNVGPEPHLHHRPPEVHLVAGLEAHAAAVVGADVDGFAAAVDAGARGVLLGAQPVAAGGAAPGDAGVPPGARLVDLPLLTEGDVVAPPHPAVGVHHLVQAAEVDAIAGELVD